VKTGNTASCVTISGRFGSVCFPRGAYQAPSFDSGATDAPIGFIKTDSTGSIDSANGGGDCHTHSQFCDFFQSQRAFFSGPGQPPCPGKVGGSLRSEAQGRPLPALGGPWKVWDASPSLASNVSPLHKPRMVARQVPRAYEPVEAERDAAVSFHHLSASAGRGKPHREGFSSAIECGSFLLHNISATSAGAGLVVLALRTVPHFRQNAVASFDRRNAIEPRNDSATRGSSGFRFRAAPPSEKNPDIHKESSSRPKPRRVGSILSASTLP